MRKRYLLAAWVVLASAGAGGPAGAAEAFPGTTPDESAFLTAEAVASHTHVRAGESLHVALVLNPKKGWYYYSPDPGSSGDFTPLAASIEAKAGPLKVGETLWPPDAAHEYQLAGAKYVNNSYDGRTVVYVPLSVPPNTAPGAYKLTFHPRGQICGELCVNLEGLNEVTVAAEVTVGADRKANPKWDAVEAGLA